MLRQASRYYRASLQDDNPIVGYLHASYAINLLDTILGMVPRQRIERLTGVNWDQMRAEVAQAQDHYEQILMDKTGIRQELVARSKFALGGAMRHPRRRGTENRLF
jgi:hypothetical protein